MPSSPRATATLLSRSEAIVQRAASLSTVSPALLTRADEVIE
jgi:hypothetical protein